MSDVRTFCPIAALAIGFLLNSSASSATAVTNETARALDPEAIELLKEWVGARIALQQFTLEVRDTIDEVAESGQKVQYAHRRRAILSRPDRLRIESDGDIRNRTFYKDGMTVTIVDSDANVFARAPDTGSIDEMLDRMDARYGVRVPLADIITTDAAESLLDSIETADYLGRHRVGDYTCDHLAFTQETIDWQVWLDVDEGPHLRKLIITYKLEDGAPQYTMWVTQFDVLDDTPDALFAFDPTPELKEIELRPIAEAPWEE